MAIPESQLETWSHQGASAQSRDTYATVKGVLESASSPYYAKDFHIRLQGSYGNDTNIYRDSDVDVLIRLDSIYYHDARLLPADQYAIYQRKNPGSASYSLSEFKKAVADWLHQNFGTVRVGSKAIFIPGSGNRRDCDVLACAKFRYYWWVRETSESFAEGICFFLADGTQIVNFPVQHSENCTSKHQETKQWFKPMVRIYKNMRNHLIDKRALRDGVAPSYFIEGMLWNVPSGKFGTSFANTFVETFDYIASADRSEFKCANGIHDLFGPSETSWSAADCQTYLDQLRRLWKEWPHLWF